jgi:pimeloyl-ACP methyl ester carboxylesterase
MDVQKKLEDHRVGYMVGEGLFEDGRPTLVMIHGAGGRAQTWQNQITLLDGTLNVLALDLPGHGETADKGQSSISEYTQWLGHLLKALFDRPIFLMGHSMGGAIVQDAALNYPDKIKGIILVATGPRLKVAPMFLEGLTNNFEETVSAIMGYAYRRGTDASVIEQGKKMMIEAGSRVVYNAFLACDRFDSRERLSSIHLPCLILSGQDDLLALPTLAEAMKGAIAGSILKILPDAGHMVMIERYRELNEAVQDFVLAVQP